MTESAKKKIASLRNLGLGYKKFDISGFFINDFSSLHIYFTDVSIDVLSHGSSVSVQSSL